jgi:hypothetical protein
MSKTFVRIVTVVAIALAVTLPAFAAKGNKGGKGGKGGAPVQGTIESVNADANTIVVKTETDSKTIKTDGNTKVAIGKNKDATVADLKPGMTVNVMCKGECASMISVGGKKKK